MYDTSRTDPSMPISHWLALVPLSRTQCALTVVSNKWSTLEGGFATCSTPWLRVTVYVTGRTNPNPTPKPIGPNQPLVGVSPLVSHTVCFNHGDE